MNLTVDEIVQIIGAQQIEIVGLRKQIADLQAQLKKLSEVTPEPAK
jgi:hypothetical protein